MHSLYEPDVTLAAVPGPLVSRLRRIDLAAGSESMFRHQVPELLTTLAVHARGESITASSAIEGVVASPERARAIIQGRPAILRTRNEQQLAGYREALDYLFTQDWRPVNVGLLLHLHRLLWSQTNTPGGQLKTEDNLVVDRSADGTVVVRFRPVSAASTEFYLTELVNRFVTARAAGGHHPMLLIGTFILDLMVIHPFADGNGRVARLIANALLADDGYGVGRWVSIEQLIAESADAYYDSLRASTEGWHEGAADVWPWLDYFVGVVATAYDRFSRRVSEQRSSGTKQDRVRRYVLEDAGPFFRVADVRSALPGVSDNTIRLVLMELRDEGRIISDGSGRSAGWRRLA